LSFALATDSGYGDKKKTVWVEAVLFGKRAESLDGMLLKGSSVLIRGELIPETYVSGSGEEKHKLKLMVDSLEFAGVRADQSTQAVPQTRKPAQSNARTEASGGDFGQDDIPFAAVDWRF